MKRRLFLSAAGAGLAVAALDGLAIEKSKRPLRLLILGGTRFIGLHMTELALARGHTLTFFNRGRTNTDRFPEVERLRGDRNGDLKSLAGREWDAVIDNSGYVPRHVREAAQLLEPRVGRYVFISTVSVYESFARGNDENSPLGKLEDESVEKVDGATYGPLKALCEKAALSVFGPDRTSIVRPGLIVGPDDNTDRFTYWPARAALGGRMIAPNDPRDPMQVIDARFHVAPHRERHRRYIQRVIAPRSVHDRRCRQRIDLCCQRVGEALRRAHRGVGRCEDSR
jgi:2'-hydroxyisoflavone reductase